MTNALGDFRLCVREAFFEIGSLEEQNNVYSYHVNSTFSYSAYVFGLKEEILDKNCVVYR